jgi:osmotically-inducible protein OsmY
MENAMSTYQVKVNQLIGAVLLGLSIAVMSSGCAPTATTRSVGTTVDDATITAKVKTEIAKEEGLGEALAINVDTYRGVVSLAGFVDSDMQVQKAANCARRVNGVMEVKNNLAIKPKS